MNPIVDEATLADFYQGPYWQQTNASRTKRYRFEKQFRRALLFAREVKASGFEGGGKILEIGSGFGGVVWAMCELLRSKPYAIELDEDACAFQESLGVTILRAGSDVNEAEHPLFDVVVLSHVLEHQLEPRALLRTAFSRVKPDGIVVLEVPDGHFVVDGGLDHPTVFTSYSFRSLLEEFFEVVSIRSHPGIENTVLPPKYILALAGNLRGKGNHAGRFRVPRMISAVSQVAATKLRNFGPLRGLNARAGKVFRTGVSTQIRWLFSRLPTETKWWVDETA